MPHKGAYNSAICTCTGKTNAGAFKGFAAGEVLFLGATGSKRGDGADDDWEITFRFAANPNQTGLSVGSIIGISKKGWEYLWVRYADAEDTGSGAIIKKPAHITADVERVYEIKTTRADAWGAGRGMRLPLASSHLRIGPIGAGAVASP